MENVAAANMLFLPEKRYYLSCETITSANSVDDLFYRIDMPGHVKHDRGDTFRRMYLSYHGFIEADAFFEDFAPDDRYLYIRDDDHVPERFIRAVQVASEGGNDPWLAGMTLDPSATCEAWCHQRKYVCFIQELHRQPVPKGETIGAAYVVGYFDSVEEMYRTYDAYRDTKCIEVDEGGYRLLEEVPQE